MTTTETGKKEKYKKLALGMLFDAIGMASFTLPFIGEFSDIIWAPLSALIMTRMYKGKTGKVAGLVSLLEELAPGLDFIPTFTLTWIYQYMLKERKVSGDVIDV
ncbi:MAG: hypothetical protein HRT69_09305 [Flavobacteriaceae bacterium]|nr:hypothetical protein [Flavobacteriaceae bacterium]